MKITQSTPNIKYKIKPIAKFRIFAWRSTSLFFRVYIWKYKKDMHASWDRYDQSIGNCDAFTHPYTITHISSKKENKRNRLLPICGEMHFYLKNLGTEVITHESTHAAMTILRRLKFNFNKIADDTTEDYMKNEEVVAYIVGHFAKQIVDRIYKLNILIESSLNSSLNKKKF